MLADGLRVREGPPGLPGHENVVSTLAEGDLVLVEWSPLAYRSPSESGDGRGWYNVRVGGTSPYAQLYGWVAAGESGLEYLASEPAACGGEGDLEHLIFSTFDGEASVLATPWERLACNGSGSLELQGVLDYVCNEGGVYPYRFDPYLAAPLWCSALFIDDYDADGFARYGQGLVARFAEFAPEDLERGDVLEVRGHFDDPLSSTCSAETEPGFDGPAVDVPFLVLFCREQFVPEEWNVVDHRDLAPLPWGG